MKYTDIGELYAAGNNNQRAINRAYLQKVLQNVIFLARQGLRFRGNWIPSEMAVVAVRKNPTFTSYNATTCK